MKAFISSGINGALQTWDQHAVDAVYPGSSGTVPPAPASVTATATTTTRVVVSWTAVAGATSYQVYRRSPGTGFTLIGTPTTNSFTDNSVSSNTSYLYRVRAVNSAGTSTDSPSDLATTVIFTDDPLVARSTVIKAVHLAELRTAVNAVRALAGLTSATFTDSATRGVVVKAVHINELRTVLDTALSALGLATGGYTDTITRGVVIKAIHFQELRNRVK
jgi:fibronectin type 3 domain-containing protein